MMDVYPHEFIAQDADEKLRAFEYKNPIVIYHSNCADGFAAAWCFWSMQETIQANFDFHPGIYNEPPPDVKDRIVYLVDFSYKIEVVREMLEKAEMVYLIDHHKTAIENLQPLVGHPKFFAYTDVNRSGAMLAWDFLHNVEFVHEGFDVPARKIFREVFSGDNEYASPPQLLLHIQDRDLWKFELDHTREIQAALFAYPYDFQIWNGFLSHPFQSDICLCLKDEGAAIERKHFKDIKELLNVCCRYTTIGGHLVPVANLPYTFASDAGHIMAKEYEEGTKFAATYYDTATHRIFSLRSNDTGIDVSGVAAGYGGGGHRNAAGFRVDRTHDLARF